MYPKVMTACIKIITACIHDQNLMEKHNYVVDGTLGCSPKWVINLCIAGLDIGTLDAACK